MIVTDFRTETSAVKLILKKNVWITLKKKKPCFLLLFQKSGRKHKFFFLPLSNVFFFDCWLL